MGQVFPVHRMAGLDGTVPTERHRQMSHLPLTSDTSRSPIRQGAGRSGGVLRRLVADRPVRIKIIMLIAVMTGVAGMFGISHMSQLNSQVKALYNNGLLPLKRIDTVANTMLTARSNVLSHAISSTNANLAQYERAMSSDDATFTTDLDIYAANSVAP